MGGSVKNQLNTDSDDEKSPAKRDIRMEDTISQKDDPVAFDDFVLIPRIKKFHKRQSVVPVNHLLQ
jgi:hypothetical protein